MLENNQKQMYRELNQKGERYEDKKPDNDWIKFGGSIWDQSE